MITSDRLWASTQPLFGFPQPSGFPGHGHYHGHGDDWRRDLMSPNRNISNLPLILIYSYLRPVCIPFVLFDELLLRSWTAPLYGRAQASYAP